ncbi:hypothetical protein N7373_02615 [Achromobacter mucicolens]|uniref:hypothetical protein n=1 Tax=Achromobacter mucicolens TaxID=1389922 RepID=UPI00244C53AF|nr:hypothetical protein [Achromobacter mucicolens]MDH0090325.1 hypothetical protein [Achromobacter mucicolens]
MGTLTGAALRINNPISVTGNYSQTGGGLAFNVVDIGSYGYLDVNGTMTFNVPLWLRTFSENWPSY